MRGAAAPYGCLALLLLACSNHNYDGGVPGYFNGAWECNVGTALTFTAPPNQPSVEEGDTAVEVCAFCGSTFSIMPTDVSTPCPLDMGGSRSTIGLEEDAGPETCSWNGLTLHYTSGTATADNAHTMNMTLMFSFSGALSVTTPGEPSGPVAGTGSQTFVCQH